MARLHDLLAANLRAEALAFTMSAWGSPDEQIAQARRSPMWPGLLDLAPTPAYDAACIEVNQPPGDRISTIIQSTLVLTGDANPFFHPAAEAIAALVPRSALRTLPGQQHVIEAETFAPVLCEFFTG